ncbi:MAG: hypothetical protein IJX71_03975 [Oscillospiraceae bacterium]|nr:hypothetical protein [Oscillospiraceae bacterium]
MWAELFFLHKNCPSCGNDDVVAMYEQCQGQTGNWYAGFCGKLCLRCGWTEESKGRQAFPFYTGKYCYSNEVNLDSGKWNPFAVQLIKQMKNCDGDMDVATEMRRLAQKQQAAAHARQAQLDRERRARQDQLARERQAEQERLARERRAEAERLEALRRATEYEERLRREEAERRAREEAERKRQAEQEARNQRLYQDAVARGKNALRAGQIKDACDAFHQARNYWNTWEIRALLAEAMAKASNADSLAQSIIDELTPYFQWKQKSNCAITMEEYLWIARAYVAVGNMGSACYYYFLAGDIPYKQENYALANAIFQEALKKTPHYQIGYEFKIAFAYARAKEPFTDADRQFCINYYSLYLKNTDSSDVYAHGNLAILYAALGNYQNAITHGQFAASHSKETYFYLSLANAFYHTKKWAQAIEYYNKAAVAGKTRQTYRIACALEELEEYDEAKEEFESLLPSAKDPADIYEHLLDIAENNYESDEVIAGYRLELMKLNACLSFQKEEWLQHAEDNFLDDIAAQMLELMPEVKQERERTAAEEALETAQQLAQSPYAEDNARAIIENLNRYLNYQKSCGQELTMEQYLWLARAYAAIGMNQDARSCYFRAGDISYQQGDYAQANELYQEGIQKTGDCQQDRLFRAAYAYSKAKAPLTDEDHRYCISLYQRDLEADDNDSTRANLAYHHNLLREYEKSVQYALPAAQRGQNATAIGNLAHACFTLERWADAETWYLKHAELGQPRNHFRIAVAQQKQKKYVPAEAGFLACIQNEEHALACYRHLSELERDWHGFTPKAAEYDLKQIELGASSSQSESRAMLEGAEAAGYTDLAEQMLELMPWLRDEREQKAREEAKRKEEEMLLVLF